MVVWFVWYDVLTAAALAASNKSCLSSISCLELQLSHATHAAAGKRHVFKITILLPNQIAEPFEACH